MHEDDSQTRTEGAMSMGVACSHGKACAGALVGSRCDDSEGTTGISQPHSGRVVVQLLLGRGQHVIGNVTRM